MIKIARRLRPFSHRPGIQAILPGTRQVAEYFPTIMRIFEEGQLVNEYAHQALGITLDLERGELNGRKSPLPRQTQEKLDLGISKAQNWERVVERALPEEIYPFWFTLAQWQPPVEVTAEDSLLIRGELMSTFKAGFTGIFVPQVEDRFFQGYPVPPVRGDPHQLIQEGARQIRVLFIEQKGLEVAIKRSPFAVGKMLNLVLPGIGILHIEWTKHQMRRLYLEAKASTSCRITFPSDHHTFRLNQTKRLACGSPFEIAFGHTYLLDQFQK